MRYNAIEDLFGNPFCASILVPRPNNLMNSLFDTGPLIPIEKKIQSSQKRNISACYFPAKGEIQENVKLPLQKMAKICLQRGSPPVALALIAHKSVHRAQFLVHPLTESL